MTPVQGFHLEPASARSVRAPVSVSTNGGTNLARSAEGAASVCMGDNDMCARSVGAPVSASTDGGTGGTKYRATIHLVLEAKQQENSSCNITSMIKLKKPDRPANTQISAFDLERTHATSLHLSISSPVRILVARALCEQTLQRA